ncbi:hypothetical protein [Psychrobacillus sp. FSL H8-0510]|uniref:hypothetical protein n=1 Tax=Psychrobacillus sp. FSL H8-0510 TaxID=2921394 RepID=UPI0030F7D560
MSTKIYNGYRLPAMNLQELNQFILNFKSVSEKLRKDLYERYIANLVASDLDNLAILGKEKFIAQHLQDIRGMEGKGESIFEGLNPLRLSYQRIESRYQRMQETQQRDPAIDLDCELILLPAEEGIYVLLYAEHNEIRKLWEQTPGVSEYGYWNNVDRLEGLTENDWKEREQKWTDLGVMDNRPVDIGMSISVIRGVPSLFELKKQNILSQIRSFDERLQNRSESAAYDVRYKAIDEESSPSYRKHREINQWLTTEEGQKEIDKHKAALSSKLLKEITYETARSSYKELSEQLTVLSE